MRFPLAESLAIGRWVVGSYVVDIFHSTGWRACEGLGLSFIRPFARINLDIYTGSSCCFSHSASGILGIQYSISFWRHYVGNSVSVDETMIGDSDFTYSNSSSSTCICQSRLQVRATRVWSSSRQCQATLPVGTRSRRSIRYSITILPTRVLLALLDSLQLTPQAPHPHASYSSGWSPVWRGVCFMAVLRRNIGTRTQAGQFVLRQAQAMW